MDDIGGDNRRVFGQHRAALHLNRFDGCFSADAATRTRVEIALQSFEIDLNACVQFHRNRITRLARISRRLGSPDSMNLRRALENAFGEQETRGQLEIMAGRTHGDGNGPLAELDFERFLDGQQILQRSRRGPIDLLDRYRQDAAIHSDLSYRVELDENGSPEFRPDRSDPDSSPWSTP